MTNVLLLGSHGFLGSYIRKKLEHEYSLINVVRNKTSRELGNFVDFEDITADPISLSKNIDAIVIACQPNNIHCADEEQALTDAKKINRLVECIIKQNEKIKVVNISTLQSFKIDEFGTTDESSEKDYSSPYSRVHNISNDFLREHIKNLTIIYPSNIYGIPLNSDINRKTLVPMCFLEEIHNSNSLTINSHGQQKRNFVSAEYIAKKISEIIKGQYGLSESILCSELNLSISDVAEISIQKALAFGYSDIKFTKKNNTPFPNYDKFRIKSLSKQNMQCYQDAMDGLCANIEKYIHQIHARPK